MKNVIAFSIGLDIRLKSGISYIFSNNYLKIKIDSDDDLSLEKTLTILNNVILIESVFNKNQNQNYYNVFLEKCLVN